MQQYKHTLERELGLEPAQEDAKNEVGKKSASKKERGKSNEQALS